MLLLPAEEDPPDEWPPGASGWGRMSGHVLVWSVPYTTVFLIAGEPEPVAVAALLHPAVDLLEAARAGDRERLTAAFREAVLYCPAADVPGFLAVDGEIAVFSSLKALAHACGAGPWFASTGRDLLGLLPAGHAFVLDPGAPHERRVVGQADVAGREGVAVAGPG